jgi:hypothetical protein
MLEAPVPVAFAATNPKSVNVAPIVVPCTASAYPVEGATVATSLAL